MGRNQNGFWIVVGNAPQSVALPWELGMETGQMDRTEGNPV